jgi:threonine aldolase
MAEAEVGDEQLMEDPTTNRLQAIVAELLGQEAAVLMPTGVMCNEVAFAVHCQAGDEIVMDETAHPLVSEAGAPAVLARALVRPVKGANGIFTPGQLTAALRGGQRREPRTRAVSLEQTSNFGGGTCWSLAQFQAVVGCAREHGLLVHCDGARVLNAVVATGTPAREFGTRCDSIWMALTKGLGAPMGAVLAGSSAFIDEAWRWKQRIGGAMRQSGVIAAAGIYALQNNIDRLAEDHDNARVFAAAVAELPGIKLDLDTVQTNIVVFDVAATGWTAGELCNRLIEQARVRLCPIGPTTVRAVTHMDVDRRGVEVAARALREALAA